MFPKGNSAPMQHEITDFEIEATFRYSIILLIE
jgi:hypothetical protein